MNPQPVIPPVDKLANQSSKSVAPSSSSPSANAVVGALPQKAAVLTPMGTLNITLSQTPSPPPFLQNPANVLPVVAFLGVILTVWFGWRKMRVELAAAADLATQERDHSRTEAKQDREHAAKEAHQERLTKARREVYLELISEMQKAQTALSLLPVQSIDKIDTHAGFGGLITATSKVALLGEMATVRTARELLTSIHEALLRVMVMLIPLQEYRDKQKDHEEERDKHQILGDKLAVKVNEYRRQMMASRDASEANREMAFHYEQVALHQTEASKAAKALTEENAKYSLAILAETKTLSKKLDDLIFSIRSELGLSTSKEELYETSAEMQKAAEAALGKLYEKIGMPKSDS